ncbi:MAG: DUF421 domain-containing protein [Acutalibacteraceae bacterium]
MLISIIRTVLLYGVIIAAIRIMGKRQISELQTTELVVTLLISDIAAIPMQNTSQPLLSGFIPILILVLCEIILSIIMLKKSKVRRLICGKPQIVIRDGEIMQNQLKRLRMTTEDLCEQLRLKEIFNIEDVMYAIVETNGQMSVLKKPKKDTPTLEQLGIRDEYPGIEAVIISDGEFSDYSMSLCGIDRKWITDTLKENNINIGDVFIMTANKNKDYNIIMKEREKK